MANWYKCCALQTAVASLQSTDCDTERLIGINVVCCIQQLFFYSLPDCDNEWLICISVVCCTELLLLYSHRFVILSGYLLYILQLEVFV